MDLSVRSAYELVKVHDPVSHSKVFKDIWSWKGAERVRTCMWLALHERLPTKQWRSSWSATSDKCNYCKVYAVDILHILKDCCYAKQVWMQLVKPSCQSSFFTSTLKNWFAINLNKEMGRAGVHPWQLIWGVAIWKFWKWRNQETFERDFMKPRDPLWDIMQGWRGYVMLQEEENRTTSIVLPLKWKPPEEGWMKANVDGAVSKTGRIAGGGGVIRDHHGNWVIGFAQALGPSTVYEAKQMAMYRGLSLAWDLGLRRIIIESDCKELVDRMKQRTLSVNSGLLSVGLWEMFARNWEVKVVHIRRNQNQLADMLAKEGLTKLIIYDVCPHHLWTWVSREALGFNPT